MWGSFDIDVGIVQSIDYILYDGFFQDISELCIFIMSIFIMGNEGNQ